MKPIKTLNLVCLAFLVGTFGLTAALYAKLPARVPTRFDLHGVPDGWMSKDVGAWGLPVSALVLWGFLRLVPLLASAETKARMQTGAVEAVTLLTVTLVASLQCVVLHAALSDAPSIGTELGLLLGVFSVGAGLALPRVRRNRWVGVRTPWTLSSDENWARTHRMAGMSMFVGGVLSLILTLAGASAVGLAVNLFATLIPAVYSYVISRDQEVR